MAGGGLEGAERVERRKLHDLICLPCLPVGSGLLILTVKNSSLRNRDIALNRIASIAFSRQRRLR
jgi:hypothetical protein